MRPRFPGLIAVACCALALVAAPAVAKDKPKKKEPPKTGQYQIDFPPTYVQVSVPADYDPSKYYPLVWILLIPFRIVGIAVDGVLELVRGIVLFPARLLRGPRAL